MNRIQTRSLRSFRLAGRHSLLKGPRRRTPNPTRIVEPTSVFLGLKQRYEVLWNFLSMDDSRHLIDGIKKDAINTSVHPELLKDASVRYFYIYIRIHHYPSLLKCHPVLYNKKRRSSIIN
jgi:hypothetical protein